MPILPNSPSASMSTENGDDPRSLLILYASETGTAQDAADRIARQLRRIDFRCRVLSMDAYSVSELISESLVIFLISTTGSGVEPRSMASMWNMLLRSDLPTDLFDEVSFAVFGLGDTAYEKFCWPAKKLSRRMQNLGATEICARGEGDEQHRLGIDGALEPWIDLLLEATLENYPLPPGREIIPSDEVPPPRISMSETSGDAAIDDPLDSDPFYYKARLKVNSRITAEGWFQDVRHLEFDFEDAIKYLPGDVAVIHPTASPIDVETFLASIGWGNIADSPIAVQHAMIDQSLPDHLPRVTTLRVLLTRYLDFNAVPRRSFFQFLRYFTPDELEREKLDEFLSPEGADDLYDYCYRVRRTIREILAEFRQVRIPKEYVFDIFPPMRPRQFSIASSVKMNPYQIHLCIAIVKYRTKLKVPRRGVCTTYLAALEPGETLPICIRKGLISLPSKAQTPVICIGPGTGVAPMRAVIQERIHAGSLLNTLYFGCRSAPKDQHYKAEWEKHKQDGALTYRIACSRDGPEGVKRTYIQDLMQEDAKRLWNLMNVEGAFVFISGSSNKMPAAVRQALALSAETYGSLTPEKAVDFVNTMEREGRLIEECWS